MMGTKVKLVRSLVVEVTGEAFQETLKAALDVLASLPADWSLKTQKIDVDLNGNWYAKMTLVKSGGGALPDA